jgi:hypothetical protein
MSSRTPEDPLCTLTATTLHLQLYLRCYALLHRIVHALQLIFSTKKMLSSSQPEKNSSNKTDVTFCQDETETRTFQGKSTLKLLKLKRKILTRQKCRADAAKADADIRIPNRSSRPLEPKECHRNDYRHRLRKKFSSL